ncbi:hypothetical protein PCANC_28684, partial [Puccinia coronata f. sp. avenae]
AVRSASINLNQHQLAGLQQPFLFTILLILLSMLLLFYLPFLPPHLLPALLAIQDSLTSFCGAQRVWLKPWPKTVKV